MEDALATGRVLVVGGGMGGLTAAFHLTRTEPPWPPVVTLYQEGWLLGGKCSSGRNPERAMRNEEHGLHMLMGFYENSFALLRAAYVAWDRHPGAEPTATLKEFFEPRNHAVFYERASSQWLPWTFSFPPRGGGDGFPGGPSAGHSAHGAICEALERLHDALHGSALFDAGLVGAVVPDALVDAALKAFERAPHALQGTALRAIVEHVVPRSSFPRIAARLARRVQAGLEADPRAYTSTPEWRSFVPTMLWLIEHFQEWLSSLKLPGDDDLRRVFVLADLAAAVIRGFFADEVWGPEGYNAINGCDFIEWLSRWGSRFPDAAPVLAVYGAAFAFSDGDDKVPSFAAGVALQASLRLFFGYTGSIMYDTRVGMGEALFVPLYEVLRARSVGFEFFRRLTRVVVRGGRVVRLHFAVQAVVKAPPYEPLIASTHPDLRCWPTQPRFDQLVDGDALRLHQPPPSIHQAWPVATSAMPEEVVEVGAADHVVLALPPAALAEVAFDSDQPMTALEGAIASSRSVHTLGVQVYFDATLKEMGWPYPPSTCGSYAAPLDTFADMSQLLPDGGAFDRDGEASRPRAVLYLCGVRPRYTEPGPPLDQAQELTRMREICKTWFASNVGTLLPDGTQATNPAGVDWSRLFDWSRGLPSRGTARLNGQYIAANIADTDRYVQSPPRSLTLRLPPGDTGVANLCVAGDWVLNPMSAGALESAVLGGLMAAQSIAPGAPPALWPAWPTPMGATTPATPASPSP